MNKDDVITVDAKVLKIKKNVATVIEINGKRYVLDHKGGKQK